MPLPVYGDQIDAIQGNGRKTKAAIAVSGAIAAALLAASAASNQKEADKHLAEARRLQEKAQNALAGKGKGKKEDNWEMFGDDRGAAPYQEPLLPSPNANSMASVGF